MNYRKVRGGGRSSPALCCLLLALLVSLMIAALLSTPETAEADHPNDTSVTASLGDTPPELDGVTVQVQDTQGPQLVAKNTTDETLQIYDAGNVPFLRIGPGGVEANRKAKTFYETYGPEGTLVPETAREATDEEARSSPEWTRVSEQRSWGWFDHRLETEEVEVPEEISQAGEIAEFGEWEAPVRLGDTETSLWGSYRYKPSPEGVYVASLTSEPNLSGVETQLSQGYGGATALLVQNDGEDPVTVLDGEGDPAIDIGPDEVRVNTSSPVGREANRGVGAGTTDNASGPGQSPGGDEPRWETIAGGSSFTWQDPRLRSLDGQAREDVRWEIPLESSGERSSIEGVIEWKPLEGEPAETTGETGHDHSEHDHSPAKDNHEADAGPENNGSIARISAWAGESGFLYGSIAVLALGLVGLGTVLVKRR